MIVENPFGEKYDPLVMPDNTYRVRMQTPEVLENPRKAIEDALKDPIGCESLASIARKKREGKQDAKAVIVVSDNTRPVPYKGDEGILLPVLEVLFSVGYEPRNILILIATGTHRAMADEEIGDMLDERVLHSGVTVVNHDCRDFSQLVDCGTTHHGTRIFLDKRYMEADLKIATGLVESHFMAGVSGGRKAICPGIVGEKTTYVFHGFSLMADPASRNLNLDGNPVHRESLAVAKVAGVDFLVNVTLDSDFHLTGVFCGDLEEAHLAAVDEIRRTVGVPVPKAMDIVVTHGGFVGVNHYQCAKCAVSALGILKKGGYLIIVADTTDKANAVGALNYRTVLALLKLQGTEGFSKTIGSPDWTFIPEQWQVQQWVKVFRHIPQDHLIFYSPHLDASALSGIPGLSGRMFLPPEQRNRPESDCFATVVKRAIRYIGQQTGKHVEDFAIAYIDDGPYSVPEVAVM